jgi:hypothetical protein
MRTDLPPELRLRSQAPHTRVAGLFVFTISKTRGDTMVVK